jgi:hypothetical protein
MTIVLVSSCYQNKITSYIYYKKVKISYAVKSARHPFQGQNHDTEELNFYKLYFHLAI